MAAPMLRKSCTNLCKIRCFSTSCVYFSNALATQEARQVQYPPVKPRYPPGQWGDVAEVSALRMDATRKELLAIPRIRERLEKISGEHQRVLWIVQAMDRRPRNLQYRQWLTKTHIAEGLPEIYKTIQNTDAVYERVKSTVEDSIALELEYQDRSMLQTDVSDPEPNEPEWRIGHRVLGRIMNAMLSRLADENDYLQRCQVDEDVRVESFWFAGRYFGEENVTKGKRHVVLKDKKMSSMLQFQYRHKADWQIRVENPLPFFVDMDSAICRDGPVPSFDCTPLASGLNYIRDRQVNVSGHWIGDPCGFSLLSLNLMPPTSYKMMEELGQKHALESQFNFGMTAAFGSCIAQAHNQGFSYLHDLTYPLTTQCLVTDGKQLRLFVYQLNTLRLWCSDGPSGNPLRNIVWATDPVPLFDGSSHRPNDEAFTLLLKCLLLRPSVHTDFDLRPFLPDEEAPAKRTAYINCKGEPLLPYTKIGRFEFPRNAVYF